jgi:hypothetical protein
MSLIFIPLCFFVWMALKFKGINLIFLGLICIGVTQGLCSNIAYFMVIEDLSWGLIKSALLAVLFLLSLLYIYKNNNLLPTSFMVWLSIYIFFSIFILFLIFEVNDINDINIANVLQNFSLINMFIVIFTLFISNEKVDTLIIDFLIFLGKFISVISIFQWIFFTYYNVDVNDFLASKSFNILYDGVLRASGPFYNHYGLSAFLSIIIILYITKSIYYKKYFSYFTFILFVTAILLTFNLTGILLACIGCIFSIIMCIKYDEIKITPFNIFKLILIFLISILIFIITPGIKDRIFSVLDYSESTVGAGNSLNIRNIYIKNSIDILIDSPNGIGLSLTDTSRDEYEDMGYVRSGSLKDPISADAWFLWLAVQIGIFFSFILFLLYAIPFFYGFQISRKISNHLQWKIIAFTSTLFIILVGSFSNSAILNYPPSNIIIWWEVGVILSYFKNGIKFKPS